MKPCVVATSKWLLHHRPCTSALEDFSTGGFFRRVIDDYDAVGDNTRHEGVRLVPPGGAEPRREERLALPPDEMRRVVLCSGQIYYKLSAARRGRRLRDVALVRVEQLLPFPSDEILAVLAKYGRAEIVWAQEEPKNMGAWTSVLPRVAAVLAETCRSAGRTPRRIGYVGRPPAASTATASGAIHRREERELVADALGTGGEWGAFR